MSQIPKLISRVGTCRSGASFDVPHKLRLDEVVSIWRRSSIEDRIDRFCMIEAKMAHLAKHDDEGLESESMYLWNDFVWNDFIIEELRPHLEQFGLCASPAYVQFGQQMLL